ncbi:Sel1 domain-containing protein [Dissophora ornata]|nr:Sel1 domain-containing protein [Dissophora ornata]
MFSEGQGVVKDPSEAVNWYLHAAAQGYVPAYPLLSDAYLEGVAVTKDDREAEMWASKAVKEAESWLQTLDGLQFCDTGLAGRFKEAVESCRKRLDHVGGLKFEEHIEP